VHWRPEEYWKPNTKVTLKALLYGVALGDGAYGLEDVTASFTIGRALIATADTRTHRFVVTKDGGQLFDFPASYGLDSDPGRVTRNGTHVVISKSATVSMTNRKYGYENVVVPWGVQISYNGEYVHGYEGSRQAQGSENVSHGCANLAPENARAYFDEVIPGDPVVVTGSSVPLSAQDGTYYDWAVDWNAWTGKSAA
jgi:lipoprotein-anchoring transpeptidase ErfK/SrfK